MKRNIYIFKCPNLHVLLYYISTKTGVCMLTAAINVPMCREEMTIKLASTILLL